METYKCAIWLTVISEDLEEAGQLLREALAGKLRVSVGTSPDFSKGLDEYLIGTSDLYILEGDTLSKEEEDSTATAARALAVATDDEYELDWG